MGGAREGGPGPQPEACQAPLDDLAVVVFGAAGKGRLLRDRLWRVCSIVDDQQHVRGLAE